MSDEKPSVLGREVKCRWDCCCCEEEHPTLITPVSQHTHSLAYF